MESSYQNSKNGGRKLKIEKNLFDLMAVINDMSCQATKINKIKFVNFHHLSAVVRQNLSC